MLKQIVNWDIDLFLFLNGNNNCFWDFVMYWLSDKLIWIPLYILLLYFVFKKYKKQGWIILILVAILVTLTDQISVHCFKNVFERLRPCHNPAISHLVHLVKDHCGGQFGFVSSHAANTFGIATFISFLLSKKVKYIVPLLFLWASVVAYSRIYLGVHYPLDVICGGILGIAIGVFVFLLFKIIQKTIFKQKLTI